MDYISFTFALFVTLVVIVYYIVPKKLQWVVLLAASYIYYFFSSIPLSAFLIATIILTFYAAILIGRLSQKQAAALSQEDVKQNSEKRKQIKAGFTKKKRSVLVCALILVFGMLCALKYYNFFAGNVNSLFSLLSVNAELPYLDIMLPLGISFYIFQSSGYLIDVYRGKYAPDRNIAKYALFLSFFPQLVQGPIGRYDALAGQLTAQHRFSYDNLKYGTQLALWGYFKKLVIADRLAILVETVFDGAGQYGFFVNSFAALAYGLQLYCDFSGGIDIARGIAEVMGIKMAHNFRRPYFAQTVSEFWRRWHISLGNWTRDYVFYPIVLSKGMTRLSAKTAKRFGGYVAKVLPACIATTVCFLIIGVWHGAAWKYVFYGLYYGLIISLSQLANPLMNRFTDRLKINRGCFSWRLFSMLRTLFLVSIARSFTRSGGFMRGFEMLKSSLANWDLWTLFDGTLLKLGLNQTDFNVLIVAVLILLTVGILQEKGIELRKSLTGQNLWFRWLVPIAAIIAVLIYGAYGPGYSAASFIYAQF